MVINFKIAIYTGFLAAIFLSVFPAIIIRKSFKELVENFIMFLIGFTVLGFITTLLVDTQMSPPETFIDTQMSSPKRLKTKEAGHFIHLHNVIMPSNKKS